METCFLACYYKIALPNRFYSSLTPILFYEYIYYRLAG